MRLNIPGLEHLTEKILAGALLPKLQEALPQSFQGTLTLTCECSPGKAEIDRELTGADLVAVTRWLDKHNRHGARAIILEIPAGVETKVGIEL